MARSKLGDRGRVLLVGEPSETEGLLASLSIGGFDVHEASLAEALKAAAQAEPDAIVVTAHPTSPVADTVHSLRSDERTRRVPVLLQGPNEILSSSLFRGLP